MGGIFISYRREDAAPWAGRIYERLAHDFRRDLLFMDVDNIAPGADFVRALEGKIGTSDVMLAIIGKDWIGATNANGQRRLDDPHDFVRIELESALRRNIRVIPVLVDGAGMPSPEELPDHLQPLVRRQAIELTHARFGSDVQHLTDTLVPLLRESSRPSRTLSLRSRIERIRIKAYLVVLSLGILLGMLVTSGVWLFGGAGIDIWAVIIAPVLSVILMREWIQVFKRLRRIQ
jgi:hypothetical protein